MLTTPDPADGASLRPRRGVPPEGRRLRGRWWCGLLCLLLAGPARALDPRRGVDEYMHGNWEAEHGLPQISVMATLQTRDGYFWVGTLGGLARFDGVRFTLYLKHQPVHALLETADGTLWIATWGDGLVRYRDGLFTALTTGDGLVHNEVRALHQGRDGAIWVGTNGGLNRLADGRLTSYTTGDGLPHAEVRALHEDERGRLWVGTTAGGLSSLEGGRFAHHVSPGLAADEVVRAIHPAEGGALWLATARGLKRRDPDGTIASYTRRDGLPDDDVLALGRDAAGQLWIGTRVGLARLHEGRLSSPAALARAEVRAVIEDREGSLWVGTYNAGLSRLKDRTFVNLTTADGLSSDDVRAIYEDRRGALWVGTHNAGINRVQDGRATAFTRAHGLPSNRVWSIAEDAAGTLWVGTLGGGAARRTGGRFHPLTTADGLPSDIVYAVLGARDGSLWLGTENGLGRLHDGEVQRLGLDQGLLHSRVISLLEGADGTLWIGTRGGLNRLRGGVLDVPPGGREPGAILALAEDPDGTLWLGTRDRGLWRLRQGRWRQYSTAAGLVDERVLNILPDGQGRLWLSTPRGIFRVERRELEGPEGPLTGVIYDRSDGMASLECNGGFQPAGWRTRDGRLWFPTMKGVAVVDPRASPNNPVPPPVRIEAIRVGGRAVDLHSPPRLAPGTKSLEIAYVGLSFAAPEKVRFRYKLEGFDEDWVEAGARRTAYYTTLPPGRYRFRVAACNDRGYWSESDATVDLAVQPWFHQTWWFYALAAGLVGVLTVGQHHLRMRRARQRFGMILDERTRIARELHDTLDQGLAVVSFQLEALAARLPADGSAREDSARDRAAAQHHLSQARRQIQASLVEARHSVLDLRSPLLVEWDLPAALRALAAEVGATGALQAEFRLEGSGREIPDGVKRHLLRIAQEAVSNALRHARATRVEVVLAVDAEALRLTVRDDGRGLDPEALAGARGFGLTGMRERARLMRARLEVGPRAEGGTEVTVSMALVRAGKEQPRWTLWRAIRRRPT